MQHIVVVLRSVHTLGKQALGVLQDLMRVAVYTVPLLRARITRADGIAQQTATAIVQSNTLSHSWPTEQACERNDVIAL
eukprot:8306-Heterococcus_DN1.PRE.2